MTCIGFESAACPGVMLHVYVAPYSDVLDNVIIIAAHRRFQSGDLNVGKVILIELAVVASWVARVGTIYLLEGFPVVVPVSKCLCD